MSAAEAHPSAPATMSDLRRIVRYGEESERVAVASSLDTPPELLFFLGADRSPAVRCTVAANRATPPQAHRILARDEDPAVREVLARRIAALAPGLGPDVTDRLRRMAWETLCLLAEDAVASVRAAVAETLADMPDAPRDLVLRLARDIAAPVAEPVIRLSPLLTDQDLLALIATPPAEFTRRAVAGRPCLSPMVCEALCRTEDDSAIATLLANRSAMLPEASLERLAACAVARLKQASTTSNRPLMSSPTMQSLAGLVVDEWARQLALRADLPPPSAARLREALANAAVRAASSRCVEDTVANRKAAFLAAARRNDVAAAVAALAELSGLKQALIERAARLRSAKALISIAWKAEIPPDAIGLVQTVIGGLPPEAALAAPPGQDWPLTPEEMRAQIALLTGAA